MRGLGDAGIIGERLLRLKRKPGKHEERKRYGAGFKDLRFHPLQCGSRIRALNSADIVANGMAHHGRLDA